MPRDGSFHYSVPVGTDGIADQTIDSGRYNAFVHDVETDLNAPRPISAGGTGANNASDALAALGGEMTNQGDVRNYDTFPFASGSFYSSPGATSAPDVASGAITANYFQGVCYTTAPGYGDFYLEARHLGTNVKYYRRKIAGVWQAWVRDDQLALDNANLKVAKAGDTMTGALTLTGPENSQFAMSLGGQAWAMNMAPGGSWYLLDATTGAGALAVKKASLDVAVYSAVASTSPTTGALVVAGGLGVGGNISAAGNITLPSDAFVGFTGNTPVSAANYALFANSGSTFLNNGTGSISLRIGNVDALTVSASRNVGIPITTPSTSLTTGALVVAGGLGVSASIYALNLTLPASNAGVEIGNPSAVNTPFIDFHSSGNVNDYDVRLIASGGAAGSGGGTLSIVGNFAVGGATSTRGLASTSGVVTNCSIASGDATYNLCNESFAIFGQFIWHPADNSVNVYNAAAGAGIIIDNTGRVSVGKSQAGRAGYSGAYDVANHNFYWSGSANQMWIDNVNQGNVSVTCDYRIKKDIAPLGRTWDVVKQLRPIAYTQREYTPPGADKPLFINDDTWQWGFVAHELQETLLPSAASGSKDSPTEIQSPNLLAIVAALTKALQEAMERIEALESRTTSG